MKTPVHLQYLDSQQGRRRQILNRAIWVTAVSCIAFGVFNLNLSQWSSAVAIFSSGAVCLLALWVNYKGHQTLASILACSGVLLAITYSIYDGDGLLDPGIVGYPLFILLGTLLLDRRFTLWLTAAALVSLGIVAAMQARGVLHLTIHPNSSANFLPIAIFLVTGAGIVWLILDSMQKDYSELQASENQLRRSYDLTIRGLVEALGMRDGETGGHSRRVVEMVEALAGVMAAQVDMVNLRYGAYLHDVGKIGVPDAVLQKKGPLSAEEWEIMRQHPVYAYRLLDPIDYLRPALDIPYCHHEKWDGTGYPRGLKGEEIPLAARLFSVIDVWDALTSDRPYRTAWTQEKALAYICGERGKHFDPKVVEAFNKMMQIACLGKG